METRNFITINEVEEDHLAEVIEEMKELGSPVLKAFYSECHDAYVLLEGTHRIHACKELGIDPIIEEIEYPEEEEEVFETEYEDVNLMEFIDNASNRINAGCYISL